MPVSDRDLPGKTSRVTFILKLDVHLKRENCFYTPPHEHAWKKSLTLSIGIRLVTLIFGPKCVMLLSGTLDCSHQASLQIWWNNMAAGWQRVIVIFILLYTHTVVLYFGKPKPLMSVFMGCVGNYYHH